MKRHKKWVAAAISLAMLLVAIAPGVSLAEARDQAPSAQQAEPQAADTPDPAALAEAVQLSEFDYVYANSLIRVEITISDRRICALTGRFVGSGFTKEEVPVSVSKETTPAGSTSWSGKSFTLTVAAAAGQSVSGRLTDLEAMVDGQNIPLPDIPFGSVPVRLYDFDLPADYLKVEGPSVVLSGDTVSIKITGRGVDGISGAVQTQGLEVLSVSSPFGKAEDFVLLPDFGIPSITYTCRVTAEPGSEAVFRAWDVTIAVDDVKEKDLVLATPERSWRATVAGDAPAFTVFPDSALHGDTITPDKDAEVNGITASPAGGEWTVSPEPDRGISASSGGVTINASLLPTGTYTLTYTTPSGDQKSVKVVQKVAFTVFPNSALNGDVITPDKDAEVNGITASPAGGEWTVEPLPDQGFSASSGGVTINASLLEAGTYTLTYTAPGGEKKSVKVVQPGASSSASAEPSAAPQPSGGAEPSAAPQPSGGAEPSAAPQPSGGADPGATAKPAPPIPSVAGYQSGQIGTTKASYVRISGSSSMFYLQNTSGKMERVAVPYVKDSSGKRWYPLNHGGTALFPRLENDKVTCYCIFKDGVEVPVLNVSAAAVPVIKDGYQTGTVGTRSYYVKVSGSSMMYYLRNASGKMERVAVPYVKDSTGTRWYPVNHGGTALFPKLTGGKISSYTTGSGEVVLTA